MEIFNTAKYWIGSIATVIALSASGVQAAPLSYDFNQSFGSDGTLSGTFVGDDGNANGFLDGNEVSSFVASFAGAVYSVSYSHGEVSLQDFKWKIGDFGFVDPDTGISISTAFATGSGLGMAWTAGPLTGLSGDEGGETGNLYFYDNDANVSPTLASNSRVAVAPGVAVVPEPETSAMMLLGLGGIAALRRKRVSSAA